MFKLYKVCVTIEGEPPRSAILWEGKVIPNTARPYYVGTPHGPAEGTSQG